jgi:hypothetical protein
MHPLATRATKVPRHPFPIDVLVRQIADGATVETLAAYRVLPEHSMQQVEVATLAERMLRDSGKSALRAPFRERQRIRLERPVGVYAHTSSQPDRQYSIIARG